MIPKQHSDRLQAGELCFARLIGLLLGDPRQRPMHRAPSTVGGCNAEASYRRRPPHWRRNTAQVELAVTAASPSSPATCASRKASERLLWITLAVPSKRPTPSDLRLRFFHHVSLVAVMVGRGSEADHWAWGRLVSGHLSAAGLQAADLFY
jgi:hypothetical protein